MNQLVSSAQNLLSVLDNEYVSSGISLFLVLYAGMAAPELPESVARWFENTFFRLLVFFLIIYMSKRDPTIAIIAAVGLMVSLQTLSKYNMEKNMMKEAGGPVEDKAVVQGQEAANELQELEKEVADDAESMDTDYRDQFYPGYVDYKQEHLSRRHDEPVAGFDDGEYAPAQ